jgi:Domain of unknown function (DUF4274)
MNNLAEVRRIVDELETPDQRCDAIRRLESSEDLLELAQHYNWDDGLEVPQAIIDHPVCDLGLALHLFELAEGIVWLTSDETWEYQQEWARFCEDLASRIQNGHYLTVTIPFESGLTTVQKFKAKNAGVADIFLSSIRPQ